MKKSKLDKSIEAIKKFADEHVDKKAEIIGELQQLIEKLQA